MLQGVLVVEIRRSFNLLSAGNARGGSYPTVTAHVGSWLARNEASVVAASLGSSAAGMIPLSMLPPGTATQLCALARSSSAAAGMDVPDKVSGMHAMLLLGPLAPASPGPSSETPLLGAEVAASLLAALDGSAGFADAMAALRVRFVQPECVSHGGLTSLTLSVAPPGARARGDFMDSFPTHGSADGTAAAVAAAEADLGSILGGVAASGGLISKLDAVEVALPKAAGEVAAEVAAAAASRLGSPAAESGDGAGAGTARADDGSGAVVSGAPSARVTARGTDAGSLLGSLVLAAAAAAVTATQAGALAASAGGYGKHIAVERAHAAARKQAEAAAGCGALLTAYCGALSRLLGPHAAAEAGATACLAAAGEVRRQVPLPGPAARLAPHQHAVMEVAALPSLQAKTAAVVLAAAAASALASSAAAAVRRALLSPPQPAGAARAAVRAGAAVSGAVSHALALAPSLTARLAASATAADTAAVIAAPITGLSPAAAGPYSLVVVAKPPVAGGAKTRLAADLLSRDAAPSPAAAAEQAAAVARACLLDTLQSLSCAGTPCARIVYVAGDEAGTELVRAIVDEHTPAELAWTVVQHVQLGSGTPGLSEVMQGATRVAQAACCGPTVFIGADMPAVTMADVAMAAAAGAEGAATVLPAHDGGYVVASLPVGCSGAQCFGDTVAWSTPHTFATQVAAIDADPAVARVSVPEGVVWMDVDDVDSATTVAAALKDQGRGASHLVQIVSSMGL